MRHLKNEWDQFKDCSIVGILKQRLKLVHSVLGNCHYLPLQRLWSTMKHPTRRRIVKLLLSMSATAATPCQTFIYLLLHCVFDYHIWYHGLIGCPWFSKMDRPPHPAPCTSFFATWGVGSAIFAAGPGTQSADGEDIIRIWLTFWWSKTAGKQISSTWGYCKGTINYILITA